MSFATIFRDRVIVPVLNEIGLHSDAAVNLLLGTALYESQGLRFVHQIVGPARGPYQMEPATHADLFINWLAHHKNNALLGYSEAGLLPTDAMNLYNARYATAACRLQYYRQPEALPAHDDLEGLAAYYKKYWNTSVGKATEQDFIDAWHRYMGAP